MCLMRSSSFFAFLSRLSIVLRLWQGMTAALPSGRYLQGNFQALDSALFVCPVTGLEANGVVRFVVLRKCGTVVAEKAIKQVRC